MIKRDLAELGFRVFFSGIFLALGAEHLLSDELIQNLMPAWVPAPRLASIACGLILLSGGGAIFAGFKVDRAAIVLGAFVIVVTLTVHLPSLFSVPPEIPEEAAWLWVILQRSNFAKNLCLLGVCLMLLHHKVGRYSLDAWLRNREST